MRKGGGGTILIMLKSYQHTGTDNQISSSTVIKTLRRGRIKK